MKVTNDIIKKLISSLSFIPEDGTDGVYIKKYINHNDYAIRINFNSQKIEYRSSDIEEIDGIRWGDSTTSNFENSENFVVLECIDRLLEKGYSPCNLYLEYKFPLGRNEKGKLDILVFDNEQKSYLMIECKTWGSEFIKEQKKMQKDGGQLFSYFVQDKATRYLCLYTSRLSSNGLEYKNDIIKVDEIWSELNNQKEIHDHWNKNIKDNGVFEEWANAYDVEIKALVRSRLQPLTKDDSGRIFNQFAEILRHNVVSDKPNAFNKILNLFICKIIDEDKNDSEQVEFQWLEDDTNESLQLRLNDLYKKGMHRFLDIDVTDFTEDDISNTLVNIDDSQAQKAIRDMIIKLRLQKNPEFAFIEVYDEMSFKLNARVVREIVELLQPFQFRYGHKQQFLGDFFEKLLNTSMKQESGQFFTPTPIAQYIISSLPIKEFIQNKIKNGESEVLPTVIDFACGTGHFLTEYMDRVQTIIENEIDGKNAKPTARRKINYWAGNDGKFEWASDYVYGIDADYRLVKSSKVSSFLNGDGEANIIRANGLDHFTKSKEYKGKLKTSLNDDYKDNGQFDILIANPPYSVNAFKSTVKYGEESFELFNKLTDNSSEIECLFVERMKQLLKIGGYAGIILPSSILSNTGIYTATREILLKYFKIVAITEFGSNTFMATGTNTVTLFLERRANTDYKHIQNSVNSFFEKPKDVTVLGIEKAFSKYVATVFEGVTFEDYVSLINEKPSQSFSNLEMFQDYKVWFDKLNEIKKLKDSNVFKAKTENTQQQELNKLFFEKVFAIEKEKLLYFLLTYGQKTVITKVGEKQKEKEFLGYEFSNRRGHEGIKMLPSGTKLYDEKDVFNIEKANGYVYNAFLSEIQEVDESLEQNISYIDTCDLIDFSVTTFEKVIDLRANAKLHFETRYPSGRIDSKATLEKGITYDKDEQIYQETKNIILTADNITLNNELDIVKKIYLREDAKLNNNALLKKDDIFICLSSGSSRHIGKVAYIERNFNYYSGGFMGVLRKKANLTADEDVNMKYIYYIMSSKIFRKYISEISKGKGSNIKNLNDNIGDIKIPFPPLSVQEKIAYETGIIEIAENKFYHTISEKMNIIVSIMNNLSVYETKNLDEKLIIINQYSIQPEKTPEKSYAYVDIKSVENGTGKIKYNKSILGSNAPSRARRLAKSKSVLISTVRPNLKAFSYIESEYKDCIYSTGFAILESVDEKLILSKWIYYNFKYSNNLMQQIIDAMPKGQYPSINNNDIEKLKIAVPPIPKQQELVAQIEDLEKEIQKLELEIDTAENKKKQILDKYL